MPAQIKFVDNAEKEPVIKGTPLVPKKFSKKMISMDGERVVYYVEKEYGWKAGLYPKMKFSNVHPIYPDFCEITIPIERID